MFNNTIEILSNKNQEKKNDLSEVKQSNDDTMEILQDPLFYGPNKFESINTIYGEMYSLYDYCGRDESPVSNRMKDQMFYNRASFLINSVLIRNLTYKIYTLLSLPNVKISLNYERFFYIYNIKFYKDDQEYSYNWNIDNIIYIALPIVNSIFNDITAQIHSFYNKNEIEKYYSNLNEIFNETVMDACAIIERLHIEANQYYI